MVERNKQINTKWRSYSENRNHYMREAKENWKEIAKQKREEKEAKD